MADYAKRLEFTGWVSGKEVIDTKPLLEEISLLWEEIGMLQIQLAEARQTAAKPGPRTARRWSEEDLQEIATILHGIEVSTTAFLENKTQPAVSYSVLNLLSFLRNSLITGVANKFDATEQDIFLYYNVCPKLEIDELAALEKVAGVQWQRYRLTLKGKALLASLDKSKVSKDSGPPVSQKASKAG